MIYGLSIQRVAGDRLEFSCPKCMNLKRLHSPLTKEPGPLVTVHCPLHPENYGQWESEDEMERDKLNLAKRIGLV
jgi:hypothetical protein